MRKNNPKYKLWLKRRQKHLEKKRKKNNVRKCNSNINRHQTSNLSKNNNQEEYRITAPKNFSIKDNTAEVSEFFDKIIKFTNSRKNNTYIMFDLSMVEQITADAILYLLAVMRDLQKLGVTRHHFSGNLPKNKNAKDYIVQSGFLDYVKSDINKDNNNNQCIKIMSDNKHEQKYIKTICDFVNNCANTTKKDTRFLYVLINEMMLNTCQHAYESKSAKLNRWYLFVQKEMNVIKFTFLDIGLGIPKTVRKSFKEIVWPTESSIISSALNGDPRTQTKLDFRGRGLPKIKDCVYKNKLNNFTIISNKGYCSLVEEDGKQLIKETEMKKPIVGTIFYWEMNI